MLPFSGWVLPLVPFPPTRSHSTSTLMATRPPPGQAALGRASVKPQYVYLKGTEKHPALYQQTRNGTELRRRGGANIPNWGATFEAPLGATANYCSCPANKELPPSMAPLIWTWPPRCPWGLTLNRPNVGLGRAGEDIESITHDCWDSEKVLRQRDVEPPV